MFTDTEATLYEPIGVCALITPWNWPMNPHPEVDMVSFTGSSRAGKLISVAAAETLKRVSLELGGKGANIIFADADPKAVTQGVVRCFRNTGQSCNAPTRMLVERSRYDEAVEQATEMANKTVGRQ